MFELFRTYESQYGLPANYLRRTAQIESSFNPNAKNESSTAGGLFQFIDDTASDYGLANRFDPKAATDAAARFARDNAATLRNALGRDPTAAELYLAHQQGGGGASRLLANPNARAVDIVGLDAVRLNGGDESMTAGEFASKWLNKYDNVSGGAGDDTLLGGLNITPNKIDRLEDAPMQEESGLLGGLWKKTGLDEEKRAMLAMALSGLSMRPNQGLQAAAQIKMRNASKRKNQNKTVEWLQKRGRTDLAQAVASGALDGRSAAALAVGDKRTNARKEYDELVEMGHDPGTALKLAYSSGQTINVGGGESELIKTLGKQLGEQWAGHVSAGNVAASRAQDFEVLGELLELAPQGPLQGRLAQAFPGFDSAADAVNSIVSRIAPTLRVEGSGSTSDVEYAGMLRSLPSLTNQPEGNRVILNVMQAKAQLDIAKAEVVNKFNSGLLTREEASAKIQELNSQSIMTPELRALMGGLQPDAGGNAGVLVYDPTTGGFK